MKHTRLLFSLFAMMVSLCSWCYDFEKDGIYYNILSETDKTVEVTSENTKYPFYTNPIEGDVVIPESVNGYSVTGIGNDAFRACYGLTSITIPNSVVSIGECAFAGCSGLTSISIPNSVTNIGEHAFSGCSSLTSITIPNRMTSIGDFVFSSCSGLQSVTIPKDVTSIGLRAFDGCSNLTSVTIPKKVTDIGPVAFQGCSSLTSITIPNSVTSIGDGAFAGCSSLASIVVDKDNKVYDSRNNCNAIIETESNTLITGCQNTVIPNSVTSIGNMTFYNCENLTSIIIPNSVTSIGDIAFEGCSRLTDVYNYAECPQIVGFQFFNTYGILYVLKGYKDVYSKAKGWERFTIVDDLEPQQNSIELTDGTNYDSKAEIAYDILTYTRTFSNTKWQALYVPFSMSYDDWKDEFEVGMINDVNMYDTDDNGEYDVTEVEILKLKKGTLKPNTPYFIRAKKAGEKVITLNNATLYPAEENSIDCSSTQMRFTFTGTYSGVSGNEMFGNDYYALGGGSLGKAADSSVSLKPMRWYMSVESRGSLVINPTANIRIRVAGEDIDEDEETGIADIAATAANGRIYTLDGREVNGGSIKAGIYIKNGKKYIVK